MTDDEKSASRDEELITNIKLVEEGITPFLRYLVLANSGAAVVVVSFLGASSDRATLAKFAIGPLFLFILGILMVGCAMLTMVKAPWLTALRIYVTEARTGIAKFTEYFVDTFPGNVMIYCVLSFLFFFFGCGLGLVMLLNI